MRKRLLALLLVLCMVIGIFPATVSAADAGTIEFTVGNATAAPGEEFTVAVTVENELGYEKFVQMIYDLTNEGVTLVSVANGKDLTGITAKETEIIDNNAAQWTMPDNGGELMLVTYKVNEDAAAGEYSLGMSVSNLATLVDGFKQHASKAKVIPGTLTVAAAEEPEPEPTMPFTVTVGGEEMTQFTVGEQNDEYSGIVPLYIVTIPESTTEVTISWLDGEKYTLSYYDANNGLIGFESGMKNSWTIAMDKNGDGAYDKLQIYDSGYGVPYWITFTSDTSAEEPATKYAVAVTDEIDNGSMTADKQEAAEDETVTLTAVPADGYECTDLVFVNTESGEEVKISFTDAGENTFTFTMPAYGVTVYPVFTEIEVADIILSMGTVDARPGETVKVPFTLTTELTNRACWPSFNFSGAEGLTVGVPTVGEGCGTAWSAKSTANGFIEYVHETDWNPGGALPTGIIAWVPYTVSADAAEGAYEVTVSLGGYGYNWMYDDTPVDVSTEFVAGKINVSGEPIEDDTPAGPTVSLSDADAHPGDLVNIVLSAQHELTSKGTIFKPQFVLPEGMTLENILTGKDAGGWVVEHYTDTGWMLYNQESTGYYGDPLPVGELMILQIAIADSVAAGEYTVDLTRATLGVNAWEVNFADYNLVDGTITVTIPEEPTKLDAPVLTADNATATEQYIAMDVPASAQEVNAVIEYAYRVKGEETWSDWQSDVKLADLADGTTYEVKARYNAYNDTWYVDSDDSNVIEVTTKAFVDEPMVFTIGDAVGGHGDTIYVPVTLEHGFTDDMVFSSVRFCIEKNENLTLVSATNGADTPSADGWWIRQEWPAYQAVAMRRDGAMAEGEVMILEIQIHDDAVPGTYEIGLDQEIEGPIAPRYTIDGSGERGSWIDYPVNVEVNEGTITIKEAMDAPVLTNAVALEDSITVTAPATVSGVTVEYAISTDGETWSDWQQSNVFEGLDSNTEYQLRARYVPEETSRYCASYPSNVITAATTYDDILFALGDGIVRTGKTVTIPVSVTHALTKDTTSVSVTPVFDASKLALDSAALGEALTGEGWKILTLDGTVELYQAGSAAFTVPQGEVLKLTFTVLDDAAAGDTAVSLTADLYNGDKLMNVEATVNDGSIHIHDESIVEGYAATCYADGMSNGLACSLCGEVFTEQHVIESKGHELRDEVVPATHDCKGYTLTSCENCDYSKVGSWTDALDHDYAEEVTKEATCTEDGEITFTCDCGESYTQPLPKTGHDCEAVVTDPTCTEEGYTTYTCKDCDFSYFTDVTEATGHTKTLVNVKEATETEEGYTGDTVCSVCEEVLAEGEVIPALKHVCHAEPFTDVDTNQWYHDAIDYVLENGLMNGTSATAFAPNSATSRGQLVTILYRAAGSPSVAGLDNPFADVAAGTWYTNAVIWAYHNGVTNGTSATTFNPNATITRQDLVTILYRYTGSPAADGSALNGFADAGSVSSYAKNAVSWAVVNGVINGTGNNKLAPTASATRAQIAQILMNYMG